MVQFCQHLAGPLWPGHSVPEERPREVNIPEPEETSMNLAAPATQGQRRDAGCCGATPPAQNVTLQRWHENLTWNSHFLPATFRRVKKKRCETDFLLLSKTHDIKLSVIAIFKCMFQWLENAFIMLCSHHLLSSPELFSSGKPETRSPWNTNLQPLESPQFCLLSLWTWLLV